MLKFTLIYALKVLLHVSV